jgi:spore photoproduct lyase
MSEWKPKEIIVHERVRHDPVTTHLIEQCPKIPVTYISNGMPKKIVECSEILRHSGNSMLDKIIAGKQVLYIAPATGVVDVFTMPDNRMICPHFDRLKLASNGCFYQCAWCYLKLTYRAVFPFITIRAQYDKIKEQLHKRLSRTNTPVIFNSGELADSLSLEHLTRAGREFIPWFSNSENGYLFMLTKSDNVNGILNLPHNNRTIIAWSMNNADVSKKYEIGAPSLERRLAAALKVQKAGYPVRIRIDPIIPFQGWQEAYAETIARIFSKIAPERVTLGTLRFEEGFYNMRNTIFTSGPDMSKFMEEMEPMFPPKLFAGMKKPKSGKYSFTEDKRAEIFGFAINEIRKYSNCRIALCKESSNVWAKLGMPLSKCSCVCQLDYADMS